MPDKAYVILAKIIDEKTGYLYFPVKKDSLEFGGMPQFFGGAKKAGESDPKAIARQVKEGSSNQLRISPGAKLSLIYQHQLKEGYANFYITQDFEGKDFFGPLPKANTQMKCIEKFLFECKKDHDIQDLEKRLEIRLSYEFLDSPTSGAFGSAIAWSETC